MTSGEYGRSARISVPLLRQNRPMCDQASTRRSAAQFRLEVMTLVIIGGLAALLLLWGLSEKYLWQDEAATAVLSVRMLRFGRPLAYDGINLITIDHFAAEDAHSITQRTTNPKAAVDYYISRGDLKADTVWKWQPWGQFVFAAISFKVLGQTTLAARLPFALAALATVLLLYRLVRTYCDSPLMASLAAVLLVLNTYWILHSRQCRYYSVSSLFLILTLMSYAHWQWGGRWGAAPFVMAAWCWFQVDYGTVWPVFGVLFLDAFVAHRRNLWRPAWVGVALAATIAPSIYYYELWGRLGVQHGNWNQRFKGNLFYMNQYVVPGLIVLAVVALVVWRWNSLPVPERRLVGIACAIIGALSLWVPTAAPTAFLRYVVVVTPVGCLLTAWVLVRGCGSRANQFAWLCAMVLVLTPWVSMPPPLDALIPRPAWSKRGSVFRPELSTLCSEVYGHRPDPNRLVVDWLKRNAAPADEILINYEDIPLMFYLPNPIRGGLAAFRVEDDGKRAPRFVVLRRTVGFVHWPVFRREVERYVWIPVPLKVPDVRWGNNPDPMAQGEDPSKAQAIFIARRVEAKTR